MRDPRRLDPWCHMPARRLDEPPTALSGANVPQRMFATTVPSMGDRLWRRRLPFSDAEVRGRAPSCFA